MLNEHPVWEHDRQTFFSGVFASSRSIHAFYGACVARMNQFLVERAQRARAWGRYYVSLSVKLTGIPIVA